MFRSLRGLIAASFVVAAPIAFAGPYSSLVVFGDSLSDGGNNSIIFDTSFGGARTPTPISSPGFIPTFTYTPSNRYSNGPVWVETVASVLGVPLAPSLAGGTNWAFGGATTGPISASLTSPFPASLLTQAAFYLGSTGGVASSSALYVIAGGGNDARAVLNGLAPAATTIINYASNTTFILNELYAAGARNFLVVNTPDVGKTPALQSLGAVATATASGLTALMNAQLNASIAGLAAGLRSGIRLLDAYALVDSVFATPSAFGISDATSACAFTCVAGAASTFFWDGIHPTAAGHLVIANVALRLVPEPAMLALLAVMFCGLVVARRRAAR